MKTTDAQGKTKEQAVASAKKAASLHGKPVVVGRLYVSARRWLWGERFDDGNLAQTTDGARWEPAQVVWPEAA